MIIKSGRALVSYGLLVLTVSVGASLLASGRAHAVNYADYPGGLPWIQQIDQACENYFWSAASRTSNLKAVTNASAYYDHQWISADNPTGTTTINVDAGSTAPVALRINHLVYICYVAMMPGINDINAAKTRMSTPQATDGHDDSPAPWSGYNNSPNRTHYGFGLYGLSANIGSTNWNSSMSGTQIIGNYTSTTRFWHISYPFYYYPPPGGFTADTTVTITANSRWINQYYQRATQYRYLWQIDCIGQKWNDSGTGTKPPANHSSLPDSWFTDQCGTTYLNLSFLVHVNQNYNLTPNVTSSRTTASVGETVTPNRAWVNNAVASGGTTQTGNVDWRLVTFAVNPGAGVPVTGTGSALPETYYNSPGVKDVALAKNGTQQFYAGGGTNNDVTGYGGLTIGDYPVGTRVCWALSVQPYTQTSTDWRYGTPYCIVISKSPSVQVWGSDLWVGVGGSTSNVSTSLTGRSSDNKTYGSWAEYAIVASGSSTSMGSGAALNNGVPGSPWSGVNCSVVQETFTNAGSTGCGGTTPIGNYNNAGALPDVASAFKVDSGPLPAGTVDVSTLASGVYSGSGTISLSGETLAGKWIVINAPSATVNIIGDLKYTNAPISSVASMPQLVIIANQINIAGSVKQIDAWLIARSSNSSAPNGSIYTCSDVSSAANLNANNCNNTLVVNGPVSAQHLFLYRTAGAGTGSDINTSAETFNLRPDAYMWAYQRASGLGQVSTMQTKELPPRF